jgi:hypothetical protein
MSEDETRPTTGDLVNRCEADRNKAGTRQNEDRNNVGEDRI